jgi:hypothetical protein
MSHRFKPGGTLQNNGTTGNNQKTIIILKKRSLIIKCIFIFNHKIKREMRRAGRGVCIL